MRGSSGNSLMEMVVVLAILSLLATMAAPYATKSFKRDKEIQLRETLQNRQNGDRPVSRRYGGRARRQEKRVKSSANGYPVSLQVLVDGIEKSRREWRAET